MQMKRRLDALEARRRPEVPTDIEKGARQRFRDRLAGIRERLAGHPLPPRETMSIAERLATASTKGEFQEAAAETRAVLQKGVARLVALETAQRGSPLCR